MTDHDLDERLASLARDAQPERDLWPALRASLPPRETAQGRRWLPVAAGILLFGAGLLTGRYLDVPAAREEVPAPTALAAAAEVQRTGAAYVRALADLRVAQPALPPAVVVQGRSAAIATLEGAAWELRKIGPRDSTATQILAVASSARQEESND